MQTITYSMALKHPIIESNPKTTGYLMVTIQNKTNLSRKSIEKRLDKNMLQICSKYSFISHYVSKTINNAFWIFPNVKSDSGILKNYKIFYLQTIYLLDYLK